MRLEGWATGKVRVPTLRDASLRDAPQDEVNGSKRYGEDLVQSVMN